MPLTLDEQQVARLLGGVKRMIRIPQHREDDNLNDLPSFIRDLESFQRQVGFWEVKIEECTGHGYLAFEELTSETAELSPKAFETMCLCINQTIDGIFSGIINGKNVVSLVAVDSSFWEITSSIEFEEFMVNKYGLYNISA